MVLVALSNLASTPPPLAAIMLAAPRFAVQALPATTHASTHLMLVIRNGVTPAAVAAVIAMFALPSQVIVRLIPATLHPLNARSTLPSVSSSTAAIALGGEIANGKAAPAALPQLPLMVALVQVIVTAPTLTTAATAVVPVQAPPGATVALTDAADWPAAASINTTLTQPARPSRRNFVGMEPTSDGVEVSAAPVATAHNDVTTRSNDRQANISDVESIHMLSV